MIDDIIYLACLIAFTSCVLSFLYILIRSIAILYHRSKDMKALLKRAEEADLRAIPYTREIPYTRAAALRQVVAGRKQVMKTTEAESNQ